MEKRKLTELIVEHKEKALSGGNYIVRDSLSDAQKILNQKEIHIISGVRRCGKSTLMRLLMGKLIEIGRTIENIVFIELKRRGLEVYYWKDKKGRECDFLIKKGRAITEAVQVSSNISTMDTRDREITGAIAAAEEFGLKEVKILTTEDLGSETVKWIKIQYIPIWRWLCS